MGWGRMDDGFDDHPKVLAILDEDDTPTAGLALGLWSLCFAWAHRNTRKKGKIPGLVPSGLPRRYFGPYGKDGAALLVKHGLWDSHESGGWLIHDFEDYLPTEETREARSEAGRRGAAKRWAEKHAAEAAAAEVMANSHDGDDSEPSSDGNLPSACHDADGNEMASDSNAVANDGSRAPARWAISKEIAPTPTPEPETTSSSSSSVAAASRTDDGEKGRQRRATRLPMNFAVAAEMRAWAEQRCPGIDIELETEKFENYWRSKGGKDATKLDWAATWRNWMLNAFSRMPVNGARASPAGRRPGYTGPYRNPADQSVYDEPFPGVERTP